MRKSAPRPAKLRPQELPPVPPSLEAKETAALREIREMQIEMESLKKAVLSETNIRSLEHDFYREFEHMKKEMKESLEKNRDAVDRMEAEIKFIKEDIGRIMRIEEEMNRLNMKGLTRDVEGLKEKSNWLETSFKSFDIDPIIEKITEIEDKIKIMKASQPIVLE
jgi:chromosome segregation ATPase